MSEQESRCEACGRAISVEEGVVLPREPGVVIACCGRSECVESLASKRRNGIVERTACPACGAPEGVLCTTVIDGVDTGWTHDARAYADMGVRARLGPSTPAPVPGGDGAGETRAGR